MLLCIKQWFIFDTVCSCETSEPNLSNQNIIFPGKQTENVQLN